MKESGFLIGALVVILYFVFYNPFQNDKWSLFVYPDGDLAAQSINALNAYDSFEDYREGYEFSKKINPKATFECGYRCKIQDNELGLYICKETRD